MERFRGVRTVGGLAFLIGLVGVISVGCGTAPGASPASVVIAGAWVRPAPLGGETAAYLTITNPGSADRLLSIQCTIAGAAMIHQTTTDTSGMTGMAMVESLPIPAGATVTLAPGGTHVMISGLTQAVSEGGSVELRLVFEYAGAITVAASVKPG
jgi:periplasmic copper chaperone A